jgi:FtsZ-binding cell division protein ZapB
MGSHDGFLFRTLKALYGSEPAVINEPTVDYNGFNQDGHTNTSHRNSVASESTIYSTSDFGRRHRPSSSYRDMFHESQMRYLDDDISNDLELVYHQQDDTCMKLKSLPYNYPGSFPSESRDESQYSGPSNIGECDYRRRFSGRTLGLGTHDDAAALGGKDTFAQPPATTPALYKECQPAKSLMAPEATQLRLARANANIHTMCSIYKPDKIRQLAQSIDKHIEFLVELEAAVDTGADDAELWLDKYEKLHHEYTQELIKCNQFYEAYYKLAYKYADLKRQSHTTTHPDFQPNTQFEALLENLNIIKTITTNQSIARRCTSAIAELKSFEEAVHRQSSQQQESIRALQQENMRLQSQCTSYRDELTNAKSRLRLLESAIDNH